MEVELQNIHKATSSDYWSLASNQYPSGKFPKVSVGITIPRAGSVSRGRDAAATPAFETILSQGTDGRSRPPKGDNASLRVSQEAANHDRSTKGAPEDGPVMKVSVSQPNDNTREQTGTFSFGTRREQGSNLDKFETPEFISSQGKQNLVSTDKSKPNSEMLRMKLWEILGGTSQKKQAVASSTPDDIEIPDQPKCQTANGPSSGNKQVFTSPVPDNIKTPDPLSRQTVNFTKCKPSSDPIESDSDSPKVVEIRPVTRSLGRKKAPAASKQQSRSAKKPLSTFCSAPKQKMLDNVFAFNEKCTPKTVVKHAIGDSGSFRNLRSSNRKAKVEVQKIHYSDRISDKTTQDDREGNLSSRNAPSEKKGQKDTSFSSLSRTGKTAESCSRSPKRGRRLNVVAKVGPGKMQFSENLLAKTLNDGHNKLSSPRKTSLKSKANDSFSSPHQRENNDFNIPENSDRSPHAHRATQNNFNSKLSDAANPSPEPKMYACYHDASTEINGEFGQKVASPWADRFRDTPDYFVSPTLAANVNISPQISKGIDEDLHTSKYPKTTDRSRSSSLATDPESEPLDEMDKTNELPGNESPDAAEERENSKQPCLSPLSPTEDEGAKSSNPSFAKGYKSHKWLSDIDSLDKSPLEHVGRKSNLKEDSMSKRRLSSPAPFATSGTQETIISYKEQEQCQENYLTRAFDQLVVVLGRFQTKIKSETSKKSSEILAATGEIIRQHLVGIEVQMQADVDKLVNAGKSKRKRVESTFEEQQEKLRILHEKFKEEVNNQLLHCRKSVEDFESYHAELKGVADKQKSSHKKLLVNAEKTIGNQLNDAETKIAEVQQRARKRMNGLKYVLKELIAESAD
ncbi:meiosis-specific protein PAIR3-like [Phragmites australis]|uniref:meiosis-specific protein PAIR3-like n=1 Tax=Phragmites australis TaxID=29695 RepID=UPI002D77D3D8|nr:meiosis-specific protein PAIR3-like [Phragmites australis]